MEDDVGSALDVAHVLQTVGAPRGDVMEITGPEARGLLPLGSLRIRLELSLTDQDGLLRRVTVKEGGAGPRGKDVLHQGVRALRFAAGEPNEHGHAHDMKGPLGRALRGRVVEGRRPREWEPSAKYAFRPRSGQAPASPLLRQAAVHPCGAGPGPGPAPFYQMATWRTGSCRIGVPSGMSKALQNSGRFARTPLTRKRPGEWLSTVNRRRSSSSRAFPRQIWP